MRHKKSLYRYEGYYHYFTIDIQIQGKETHLYYKQQQIIQMDLNKPIKLQVGSPYPVNLPHWA